VPEKVSPGRIRTTLAGRTAAAPKISTSPSERTFMSSVEPANPMPELSGSAVRATRTIRPSTGLPARARRLTVRVGGPTSS
jgi:hypothetical protein